MNTSKILSKKIVFIFTLMIGLAPTQGHSSWFNWRPNWQNVPTLGAMGSSLLTATGWPIRQAAGFVSPYIAPRFALDYWNSLPEAYKQYAAALATAALAGYGIYRYTRPQTPPPAQPVQLTPPALIVELPLDYPDRTAIQKNLAKQPLFATALNKGIRDTMADYVHTQVLDTPKGQLLFAGVFDGYTNSDVAELLKNEFHKKLAENIKKQPDNSMQDLLKQTCLEINTLAKQKKLKSGSTAIITVVDDSTIYIANVGDSRAVGSNGQALSIDHTPNNRYEFERVGVENIKGYPNAYKLKSGLAVSRSFGGFIHVPHKLTADPEIEVYNRADFDFIILASDGIWDVISNEDAASFVRARLKENIDIERIAEELITLTSIYADFNKHKKTPPHYENFIEKFNKSQNSNVLKKMFASTKARTHDNQAVVIVNLKNAEWLSKEKTIPKMKELKKQGTLPQDILGKISRKLYQIERQAIKNNR